MSSSRDLSDKNVNTEKKMEQSEESYQFQFHQLQKECRSIFYDL
jgi:hypothetical protein